VMIRVPEQVGGGGVDDLGAARGLNGEVVQVAVVVDQNGGDGPGLASRPPPTGRSRPEQHAASPAASSD